MKLIQYILAIVVVMNPFEAESILSDNDYYRWAWDSDYDSNAGGTNEVRQPIYPKSEENETSVNSAESTNPSIKTMWPTIEQLTTLKNVTALNQPNKLLNSTSPTNFTDSPNAPNNICNKVNRCRCNGSTDEITINCSGNNLVITYDNRDFRLDWNLLRSVMNLHLRFDQNQIEFIPAFASMLVVSLNFSHNNISDISFRAFSNLTSLESLDLSHNDLSSYELSSGAFIGFGDKKSGFSQLKLKHLNLSHNQIHYIEAPSFDYLQNLKTLDLSNNPLTIVQGVTYFAIGELRNLESLNLANLDLSRVPNQIFLELSHLTELDLSNNLLDDDSEQFQYATGLKTLLLENNSLASLDEFSFMGLDNLEVLSLRNNVHLQTVDFKAFENMTSLRILDLSYCSKLDTLTDTTGRSHDSIEINEDDLKSNSTLLLNNNSLSEIQENDIPWNQFGYADISHNPFNCSCGVLWMLRNLLPKLVKHKADMLEDLKCADPEELQGTPLTELYGMTERFSNCSPKDNRILEGLMKRNKNKSKSSPVLPLIFVFVGIPALLILTVIVRRIMIAKGKTANIFRKRSSVYVVRE